MFRRAITSVLFALLGALTASGASFDPGQRHMAFQPGKASKLKTMPVLKPAQAATQSVRWNAVGVQRITPVAQGAVRVEIGTHAVTKAQDAAVIPGIAQAAGGVR